MPPRNNASAIEASIFSFRSGPQIPVAQRIWGCNVLHILSQFYLFFRTRFVLKLPQTHTREPVLEIRRNFSLFGQ